jgi:hypothetical protein
MLYDVFICHASEDKDSFVRPLAEALRDKHLEVWYDEFTLTLGDSIRRAIDIGLRQSTYGIVVLSKAFFEKNWPQYELDGLVEREMAGGQKVILTIWHGVTHDDVAAYSPALAGKWAISTDRGLDEVVAQVQKVVRPEGSPLLMARDFLISLGLEPPVVTHPYWLLAVEASNRLDPAGAYIPDSAHWGRWAFPLLALAGDVQEREEAPTDALAWEWGQQIGWAALQLEWTQRAQEIPIDVTTEPEIVLDFIRTSPGLLQACEKMPGLVAEYAPQLTIPGFGGELEDTFDAAYRRRRRRQDDEDDEWLVRHAGLGHPVDSRSMSYAYFHGGMFGPDVSAYGSADHLAWLLSEKSNWLPARLHELLLDGLARRPELWWWFQGEARPCVVDWDSAGEAAKAMDRALESGSYGWTAKVRDDWLRRLAAAVELLQLPERPEELLDRVGSPQVIERAVASGRDGQAKRGSPRAS